MPQSLVIPITVFFTASLRKLRGWATGAVDLSPEWRPLFALKLLALSGLGGWHSSLEKALSSVAFVAVSDGKLDTTVIT